MACPYFVPVEPWSESWTGPRRVPLGEPYRGTCSLTENEIDPHDQAAICNFGYARTRCSHFPDGSGVDAVRFSITTAEPLRLIWIAECEHAPVAHGTSELPIPQMYEALAQAFVGSYRNGKSPQGILK